MRSATIARSPEIIISGVSIHALLAECDFNVSEKVCPLVVSIHALLAECDADGSPHPDHAESFNPRTPCGVRQVVPRIGQSVYQFQSTHSLRSATASRRNSSSNVRVSIHALLAECDATDFIHYYSTEQIILCANLPKKTVIARLHFLSIYLSIFYSQCITPIADLPGNSCELEVGAQAMFHSL